MESFREGGGGGNDGWCLFLLNHLAFAFVFFFFLWIPFEFSIVDSILETWKKLGKRGCVVQTLSLHTNRLLPAVMYCSKSIKGLLFIVQPRWKKNLTRKVERPGIYV